jgi:hypothetical protein
MGHPLSMEFLQREERTMATVSTDRPITPLRQRMQHDMMMMRGLGPHTQQDYIRHVRRFAAFLRRSPDTATSDDIRRFQVHQHESGVGNSSCTVMVADLSWISVKRTVRQLWHKRLTNLLRRQAGQWTNPTANPLRKSGSLSAAFDLDLAASMRSKSVIFRLGAV